jgi:hypothetical protein
MLAARPRCSRPQGESHSRCVAAQKAHSLSPLFEHVQNLILHAQPYSFEIDTDRPAKISLGEDFTLCIIILIAICNTISLLRERQSVR